MTKADWNRKNLHSLLFLPLSLFLLSLSLSPLKSLFSLLFLSLSLLSLSLSPLKSLFFYPSLFLTYYLSLSLTYYSLSLSNLPSLLFRLHSLHTYTHTHSLTHSHTLNLSFTQNTHTFLWVNFSQVNFKIYYSSEIISCNIRMWLIYYLTIGIDYIPALANI